MAAALAVTDELALPLRAVGDLAAAAEVSQEEVVVITQCLSLETDASAGKLPFDDASVGAVLSVIKKVESLGDQLIAEICRVLKAGGVVLVQSFTPSSDQKYIERKLLMGGFVQVQASAATSQDSVQSVTIKAKKASWSIGSSFPLKKATKALPKIQIDDDTELIDEDSLLTEEDLKKPQLPVDGSIAPVDTRNNSPLQRVGDDDCRHGETLTCSIPHLPEDIWCHIHSLMPMHDAARAACLSHAFLRSWRCRPNITLDFYKLWPMGRGVRNICCRMRNFICIVDSILRNHSGIGLKILKLHFNEHFTSPYVDSWLQVAVTPGIEELTLMLDGKHNLPCSLLSDGVRNSIRYLQLGSCTFHPTVELGPLRRLTSLCLYSVCITGDELECLVSNSLALEQLELCGCAEIIFLKLPCTLQQLSSLSVTCERLQVIESKAPNLSRIFLATFETKISLGEASQRMKDFTLFLSNGVCYARAELPSTMPNLETLTLHSWEDEVVNTPGLPTKFLFLKHLTVFIAPRKATSYDYVSLVSFFDASPSLETLYLNVQQEPMEHESVFGHLRQLPEQGRHDRLKSVEMAGFNSTKSLVELTCCIVKKAVSLERLVLDVNDHERCSGEDGTICPPMRKNVLEEALRAVAAIRSYIEDKVPPTVRLTVVEPCARCRAAAALMLRAKLHRPPSISRV